MTTGRTHFSREPLRITFLAPSSVLNKTADADVLEVSDGQQRLATTAIFIAAIRDILEAGGNSATTTAEKYTRNYFIEYEELEGDWSERLKLNTQDNVCFRREMLLPAHKREQERVSSARRGSNERLAKAYELAKLRVSRLMDSVSKENRIRHLFEWVDFLQRKVIAIVIKVPEDVDAFTMFETLNDRGLRASQVDNIKNRLFREAGSRLSEAEELWLSMVSQIESFGSDQTIVSYLRHYWISEKGQTREQDLARRFKESLTGQAQVVTFLRRLDDHVVDYESLFYSPLEHRRLEHLSDSARGFAAATTRVMGIEQIRPLMLAVLRSFDVKETEAAFRLMTSWSMRFLVVGTGGGGLLDRNYGVLAEKVSNGAIGNTKELRIAMEGIVPNDAQFEASFRAHSISDAETARYICRSLEAAERGEPNPSIMFFENTSSFNLEHILPRKPQPESGIDPDTARAFHKRLGNLTLLDA